VTGVARDPAPANRDGAVAAGADSPQANGQGAAASAEAEVPLRHNRDFNLLWAGTAVSSFGTQMSLVAYPLLVLAATGSAAKAGLVAGATLIGTLVMLLPAGVVADRYPRKRIMIATSLVELVAVGTVAVAVFSGHVWLPHLTVVGLAQGLAEAFYLGANRGSIRRIVPRSQLPAATARTQARDQAASMAGPPIGGALFSVARFLPFAIDSVSFAGITVAAALLRKPLDPPRVAGAVHEPLRRSVGKGLRFVLGQPFLRTVAIWGAVVNGVAAGMLLMVIVLARHRGATPPEVGLLLSINAGCGLAGAMLAPRIIKLLSGRAIALITSWLLPTCAVVIANSPWVWLIGVMGAITTFTIMPVNVIMAARSAQITPDDMQAQAGNASQLLKWGLMWAGPPVFGVLADNLGTPSAVLIAAGLYAAAALWLQFSQGLYGLNDPVVAGTG
jgi:MFS family permease